LAASEALNAAFVGEDGSPSYPDSFSGVWINEDNKLAIALTDTCNEVIDTYKEILGEYQSSVVFEKAEYSYNELASALDETVYSLEECGVQVVDCLVSETENKIIIGIDENSESLLASIPSATSIDYPIEYKLSNPIEASTTALYSGSRLYNSTSGESITLSCFGTYAGSSVLLTCGHLKQQSGDKILYSSSSGSQIGTVVFHRFDDDKNGDFEIVRVGSGFSANASINNVDAITGSQSNVPVNTIVKFYGKTTNKTCYGKVLSRGNTKVVGGLSSYAKAVRGLTEVYVQSGTVAAGDSGGPVYVTAEGGVDFCGLISGYDNPDVMYMYFTPYTYVSGTGFKISTK
jgi:hypothetical protein